MSDARDDDDERLPAVVEKVPPPIKIARDHASRGPREMVFVNSRGQSISPARASGPLAAMLGVAIGWATVGAISWTFPVVLGGAFALLVAQLRRSMRGNALVLHGRLDEAEKVLTPLARFPFASPTHRKMASSTLAHLELRRGNAAAALQWAERGARIGWPRLPTSLCRGAVIHALINLDRVPEARAYFDRYRSRKPLSGDFLRRGQWETELYVALAEGKHELDAEELHQRARDALTVSTGRTLIALLAWAHHHVGDADQAWHLLREALEREDTSVTEKSMPRLHAWIEEHRAEAVAARPADEAT